MEAILIKNDKFETIGFEVKHDNKTLFNWGVSSYLKNNYQKALNCNLIMDKIFTLVRLQATLQEQEQATRNTLTVLATQKILKDGQGINCKFYDEAALKTAKRIDTIIKGFI